MASAEPLAAVVKSVNDFTLDFYLVSVLCPISLDRIKLKYFIKSFFYLLSQTTAETKGPGANVLVSPLSAALVTAMVHAGAKGETANEIAKGLRFPSDKATLEDGFKALHGVLAVSIL